MDNEANQAADKKPEEEKLIDKDEDEDEDPGCCFSYGQCLLTVIQAIYGFFKSIVMFIAEGISYCWYPFKERTVECCDCCGKRMNPEADPAYGGF